MSVYKRNRRWWCNFTINGVRYRKPIPQARLKPDAERHEAKTKLEIYEGIYEQRKPVIFSKFVDAEFKPYAESNYRGKSYKVNLKVLVAFFGQYSLQDISPLLIEKFKRERLNTETRFKRARRPASVVHELAFLSKILSLAADSGLIKDNPCRKVKRPKLNNERTRTITPEEEEVLLSQMSDKMRRIVIFALNTGMRRGEIAGLKRSDIGEQSNSIRLTETKSCRPRTVPINAKARAALDDKGKPADAPDGKVFGIKAGTISKLFERARTKAGLSDVRFHDLRHTFATRLGMQGVDPFTIAEILGHSDIKMTRRYTHSSDESKRHAVEGLEARHDSVTNINERRRKTG